MRRIAVVSSASGNGKTTVGRELASRLGVPFVELDGADLIVWLDLPIHVWLPRLLRRTFRRMVRREALWNENRESLRDAFWGRNSLFGYALRSHFRRRREWPACLGERAFVHLRTRAGVRGFLETVARDSPCASISMKR